MYDFRDGLEQGRQHGRCSVHFQYDQDILEEELRIESLQLDWLFRDHKYPERFRGLGAVIVLKHN